MACAQIVRADTTGLCWDERRISKWLRRLGLVGIGFKNKNHGQRPQFAPNPAAKKT
jgi:hypothetical protein